MADKPDGGDAFPCGTSMDSYAGMTMLEWYAGMALQGIISNPDCMTALIREVFKNGGTKEEVDDFVAKKAFSHAHAMIAERQKE